MMITPKACYSSNTDGEGRSKSLQLFNTETGVGSRANNREIKKGYTPVNQLFQNRKEFFV